MPSKVKARVVVAMIVAMQTPEANVQPRGKGTATPKSRRRPAYLHHLTAEMNPSIPRAVPNTETGSMTVPGTPPPPGRTPFDSALVRPL